MKRHSVADAPCRAPHDMAHDNLLLTNLPASVRERLVSRTEGVPLRRGENLFNAGDSVRHLYFPTSGLVTLLAMTGEGSLIELASVARQGVIGLPIVLDKPIAPYQATVLIAGTALRLRSDSVAAEFAAGRELRDALHTCATELLTDISKTVLCVAFHEVLQRACRWLLTTSDRLRTNTLDVTQEALAQSLGVVRHSVTRAMLELQDASAIRLRYGRILILNRGLLERSSCDCYIGHVV